LGQADQKEVYRGSSKQDLLDLTREEMVGHLGASLDLAPFRARQLIAWLYRRCVTDFSQMTDIAKTVRDELAARCIISRPQCRTVLIAQDGTRKYLFQLADGNCIESVLIHQPSRWTLCVSSQVGCAIGCSFCRTAKMGFKRNLLAAEIVGQVLAVKEDIARLSAHETPPAAVEDFSNIVFMGMGEPLHNLDNVIRAVCILNDNLGLNYSARKITVSTSGLVPAIKKFGASRAGANLAISLNATTDAVRSVLMPINKKYPIAELIGALREYPLKRGRRITIEYVMISGLNDTLADLARLPKLLRGIPVKINLIPYNASPEESYAPPPPAHVAFWQQSLLDAGMNSTIRWSKGLDINAACGQLATAFKDKQAV